MKKTLAFLLAMILVIAMFAACGNSTSNLPPEDDPAYTDPTGGKKPETPDDPNTPLDPGLITALGGKEITKLLLAQERLNASILRNSDSIFSNGETVLENLAAVAAFNLVYAKGDSQVTKPADTEEKVYLPVGGSKLTVSGDTYTWSDFPAYSNSYSYFNNLTGNIITSAEYGADMIDTFKKNVRVVGKWVKTESESLLLLVDENSETLVQRYTYDKTTGIHVTRRYKNEAGLNVYEVIREENSPGFDVFTRLFYIPNLRCEYVHHSLSNGTEYFDHNFYANKNKGYWEVIDVNGRKHERINLSYMALKDDIFYNVALNVDDNSTTPALVNIMTPDRKYDLVMMFYNEGANQILIELGMQSYEGVQSLQAIIPANQINKNPDHNGSPITWFEEDSILYNHSSEYPPHVNLTNGNKIIVGDRFANGAVTVENIYVSYVVNELAEHSSAGYMHQGAMMIGITGNTYKEQMEAYKAFLTENGLSPRNSTPDYVVTGITRAIEEVKQFCAWGTWNGHPVSNTKNLRDGFSVEDEYEAEHKKFVKSLEGIESINSNDQAAINLNIKFSPVTVGEGYSATYANQVVTLKDLSLIASDTTLFVEGEPYTVILAMLSTDENNTQGLIHVCKLKESGTAYAKADSFSVKEGEISFTLPELSFGNYTVVAYISTADGIRTSQYIPIAFTEVASESSVLGNIEISGKKEESGAIVLSYTERLDKNMIRPISEETLAYTVLYEDLASAVLKSGIIPEGAAVEYLNRETNTWEKLAEGTESVTVGEYRLAYDSTNGEVSQKGYVILELVYMPVEGGVSETPTVPENPDGGNADNPIESETPVNPEEKIGS